MLSSTTSLILADNESAYRSITLSWFDHSPLHDIIKKCAESGRKVIITTDHGTIRVNNPVKIIGNRNTNTNLRYKVGRSLSYNEKEVFTVANPEDAFLPKGAMSSAYVFTKAEDFFVYPNKFNHFVNYYNNTFQHGGVSLEEILIPFVELEPKQDKGGGKEVVEKEASSRNVSRFKRPGR